MMTLIFGPFFQIKVGIPLILGSFEQGAFLLLILDKMTLLLGYNASLRPCEKAS